MRVLPVERRVIMLAPADFGDRFQMKVAKKVA
jgi:hypothetical protein